MTKSELLNTAIKIFGLYYFVRFVQHFMELVFMAVGNNLFDNGQMESWYIYSGISITVIVELTIAYLATFKTELITNKISPNNNETAELEISKTDLLELALAVISVLGIVYSIPNILAHVIDNIYFHNHEESVFWNRPTKNSLIQAAVTLAIGIFLLLNSRNFAKLIVKRGTRDDQLDENSER